ncbi:hypothetical protein JHE00_29940 [Prauserella sp. ASG 168]|uniref:Uncharacterized protein n=1 Tax=Prauserella cavernicola TaxID=2800127 RepID=A0A934QZW9_9PSEU|nr:hypothetical protein [Prauserella cavernicola]
MVQGAGLLAVALVAGLVWWFIRSGSDETAAIEPTPTQEDPLTSGAFDYTTVAGPEVSDDCEANSYGDVVDWFADHPCERVSRALYTTETDGARALVSVVVVTMPQASDAQQLKAVTDTEGTGNVNDLVRDESVSLPGAPNVAQGEYASRAEDKKVTIVEAAFFGEHTDDELIARIGDDALRLAEAQP